jgi:hypothetical protein
MKSKEVISTMGRRLKANFTPLSPFSYTVVPPSRGFFGAPLSALALILVLGGVVGSTPAAHAQSASTWDKRGREAEAREDYDVAYEDYLKAHQKAPSDLLYRAHY